MRDGGLEKSRSQSCSILSPLGSLPLYTLVTVLGTPVDRHPGQEKADLGSCLLIRSKAQCIMQLCRRLGSLEREWVVGCAEDSDAGFHLGSVPCRCPGFSSQSMKWGGGVGGNQGH